MSLHPWLPQAEVIRQADVVVHHGGSGTMLGALVAGVPQVVLPQGADQFGNATALTAAGLAVRPEAFSAEAIAESARLFAGGLLVPGSRSSGGSGDTSHAFAGRSCGQSGRGCVTLFFMKASRLRFGMNLWPPFLFAGIRVLEISPDYRYARVRMRLRPWNRNFFGTHFGGSLFAMTDPFWVLLLFNQLGGDHVVWDQAGEIEFVAPGRGTVYAEFRLTDEHVEQVPGADRWRREGA